MKIDCRNLSCPQPIVETKNALEKLQENEILEIVLNSIIIIEPSQFSSVQSLSRVQLFATP